MFNDGKVGELIKNAIGRRLYYGCIIVATRIYFALNAYILIVKSEDWLFI